MEIASNYAVSVAPPSYQAATEEAKRDTRLHEQIPAPKQSEQSAAQSKAADERGGAQSTAQTMAAQSQGMRAANSRLNQIKGDERRNEQHLGKTDGDAKSTKESASTQNTAAGSRNTAAQQSPQTQAQVRAQVQAQAMGQTSSAQGLQAAAAASSASGGAAAQLQGDARAERYEKREQVSFAKYQGSEAERTESGQAAAQAQNPMRKINAAIANRYNSIAPNVNQGRNLDIAV